MSDNWDQEVHRDLGKLEGKVMALEERLAFMNAEVTAMRKDMHEIMDILNQAKGGWRTLVAVGGLTGVVVASFFKLIELLGNVK